MTDQPRREPVRLKDRVEALCHEMIDRGILFTEAVEQFEKCFITEVVARSDHSMVRAAERLGMHRNTLSKKLATYRDHDRK
jgi:DNA-binding NtrC family response regulator